MFSSFFKKPSAQIAPQQLYGSVMTHSRSPEFFTDFSIPDTVMGRFDMLSLHIYLLARRFREIGTPIAMDLSQEVFDLYVADVERALRELGIGDTSVPKKKKKMIRSFYGQIDDFDEPINQNDEETLSQKIATRYLSDQDDANLHSKMITKYVLSMKAHLETQEISDLLAGDVKWLSMESFLK